MFRRIVTFWIAFQFGCAADLDSEDLGVTESEVRGGSNTSVSQFEAVGQISVVTPVTLTNLLCTGTLINYDTVLTAAHCVCNNPVTGDCASTATFTLFNVFTPTSPTVRTTVAFTGNVTRHGNYDEGSPTTPLTNDYAVVKLTQRADDFVSVTPIQVESALPSVGANHTFVGFGGTGPACTVPGAGKSFGSTALDSISNYGSSGNKDLTYVDPDPGIGVCQGDSGGPVINASGKIVAVISRYDAGGVSNNAATSTAWNWIRANGCPYFDKAYPNSNFCNDPLCPCSSGEGDVDFTTQCVSGSHMAYDVGQTVGLPPSEDVCWDDNQVVQVHSLTSGGGNIFRFPAGLWDYATLNATIGNDTISSITLPDGYLVALYPNSGCTGAPGVFYSTTANLGAYDNVTSCLVVYPSVAIYANSSYGGAKATLYPAGSNHTMLGAVGNDNAESIKVAPGFTAKLCSESGSPGTVGWGTCQTFSGNVSSLGALANNVSNVELLPGVTVYTGADYAGTSQSFNGGVYTSANLTIVGNDTISSLIVAPGVYARLCSESGGYGRCRVYTGSNSFVGNTATGLSMNDVTSYIEVGALPANIDATSGWYFPTSGSEWTSLLSGSTVPNPTSFWRMQETYGNLADTNGVSLFILGSGAPNYAQFTTGFARTSVKPRGGTSDYFGAHGVNVSTTSAMLLMVFRVNAVPSTDKKLMALGDEFNRVEITSSGRIVVKNNANTVSGTAANAQVQRTFVLVLKIDRSIPKVVVYNDGREVLKPTWSAPNSDDRMLFGNLNGTGSWADDASVLYAAYWTGSNAQLSDSQVDALITRIKSGP